ncbi:hypothetical protein ACSHWB_26520 [Lentzea sp. HUAS TT2]|uniref:hypothetical protein n=1 Tax=Lentzea sp. HUAS TT2 TaxID=3447454 RepID=UPI003F6FEF53
MQLGQALQRKDGAALAQDVMRTLQAAQSRIAGVVQETMAPLLGADSETMHLMMDKLRSAQPPEQHESGNGAGAKVVDNRGWKDWRELRADQEKEERGG